MQRMRDQAKFQEELARRQANEDRLRSEQVHVVEEKPPAEGDVYAQLEQLQKTEARQRSEINRYEHLHISKHDKYKLKSDWCCPI